MQTSDVAARRAVLLKAFGTDHYLLAPAWAQQEGQRDFIPPEMVAYIGNALMIAFAGGFVAALSPTAAAAGKAVGGWAGKQLQSLLGIEGSPAAVSDEAVKKAIEELAKAMKSAAPAQADAAKKEAAAGLKKALVEDHGLTGNRAESIGTAVQDAVIST